MSSQYPAGVTAQIARFRISPFANSAGAGLPWNAFPTVHYCLPPEWLPFAGAITNVCMLLQSVKISISFLWTRQTLWAHQCEEPYIIIDRPFCIAELLQNLNRTSGSLLYLWMLLDSMFDWKPLLMMTSAMFVSQVIFSVGYLGISSFYCQRLLIKLITISEILPEIKSNFYIYFWLNTSTRLVQSASQVDNFFGI